MVTLKRYRLRSAQKKEEYHKNILRIIGTILKDEDFIELKKHRHHLFFNRYEHLINSSRIAYTLARWLKADINSCTLAGILHDFHNTRIKSYLHGVMAAENAKKFNVTEKVQDLIKSHMYPLGRTKVERVKGKDFWVVKMADFFSMCYEITYSLLFLSFRGKNKIKLKKNRILIERLTQEENVLLGEQA